jgi:hypothetical protein
MLRSIEGAFRLVVVAGLSVAAAGVISPNSAVGKSAVCVADEAPACRPSDLVSWGAPDSVKEFAGAVGEFTRTVTAASATLLEQAERFSTAEVSR